MLEIELCGCEWFQSFAGIFVLQNIIDGPKTAGEMRMSIMGKLEENMNAVFQVWLRLGPKHNQSV